MTPCQLQAPIALMRVATEGRSADRGLCALPVLRLRKRQRPTWVPGQAYRVRAHKF